MATVRLATSPSYAKEYDMSMVSKVIIIMLLVIISKYCTFLVFGGVRWKTLSCNKKEQQKCFKALESYFHYKATLRNF